MSSTENTQKKLSEGLQIPGLVQSEEAVEQVSFPTPARPLTPFPASSSQQMGPHSTPSLADLDTARQPAHKSNPGTPSPEELDTLHQPASVANPSTPTPPSEHGSTRALLLQSQPAVARALTNALSQPGIGTSPAGRAPLVIQGDGNKARDLLRPPQGRRPVIGLAALLLLLVIIGGTFVLASPADRDGFNFNPLTLGANLFKNPGNTSYSLIAQATATAVYHQRNDGFVPGSGNGPVVTGSPESWPVGYCTYWANLRYHQLSGNWVTWTGNAYQWAQGARMAGWNVSSQPHVPAIIVLAPGAQGASGFGHVAVVESINSDGSVRTSNMNWFGNGGGWDKVSYVDFKTGSGATFIWK